MTFQKKSTVTVQLLQKQKRKYQNISENNILEKKYIYIS